MSARIGQSAHVGKNLKFGVRMAQAPQLPIVVLRFE